MEEGKLGERLDQAYRNPKWSQYFPNSTLYHLPFIPITDLCPILLCLCNNCDITKNRVGWRFEKWWSTLSGYMEVLERAIENLLKPLLPNYGSRKFSFF